MYCIKGTGSNGEKCFKEGERCTGAEGHEYVQYKDCCGQHMWCVKNESMGWGHFGKMMSEHEKPRYKKTEYVRPNTEKKDMEENMRYHKYYWTSSKEGFKKSMDKRMCSKTGKHGCPTVKGCCSSDDICDMASDKKYGTCT